MFKTIREIIKENRDTAERLYEAQRIYDLDRKAIDKERAELKKQLKEAKLMLELNQKTDHILVLSDDDTLELLRKMKDKYDWDIELYDKDGNKIVIRNNKGTNYKRDIFTTIGEKE